VTRLSCHRFRSNEVRLWLSMIAYNLGNLRRGVPSGPGVAKPDRQLVVDEPAAAIGEDGWSIGQACPVLPAAVGREPSDQVAVRGDGGKDRRLAVPTG
jgi:hypothetical protein